MSTTMERLGQIAYQRYALERGQQAYDGTRIPDWGEAKPEIRAAWGAAAVAVGQLVASDQALLGEFTGRDRMARLIEIALGDVGRTDAETFRAGGPGRTGAPTGCPACSSARVCRRQHRGIARGAGPGPWSSGWPSTDSG